MSDGLAALNRSNVLKVADIHGHRQMHDTVLFPCLLSTSERGVLALSVCRPLSMHSADSALFRGRAADSIMLDRGRGRPRRPIDADPWVTEAAMVGQHAALLRIATAQRRYLGDALQRVAELEERRSTAVQETIATFLSTYQCAAALLCPALPRHATPTRQSSAGCQVPGIEYLQGHERAKVWHGKDCRGSRASSWNEAGGRPVVEQGSGAPPQVGTLSCNGFRPLLGAPAALCTPRYRRGTTSLHEPISSAPGPDTACSNARAVGAGAG